MCGFLLVVGSLLERLCFFSGSHCCLATLSTQLHNSATVAQFAVGTVRSSRHRVTDGGRMSQVVATAAEPVAGGTNLLRENRSLASGSRYP